MKIIKPSYVILGEINGPAILRKIEQIGRVCYKSEDHITDTSAQNFVKMLIDRGHEAMIEHFSISVKFIVDRGVSHEMVRHRMAAFAQESTRYCNYAGNKFGSEITVIEPFFFYNKEDSEMFEEWEAAMEYAETQYLSLLELGASPQEARSVLPNSLKTEIVITANLREWRHIFKLRDNPAAHPQMREVMKPLHEEFKKLIPVVFD